MRDDDRADGASGDQVAGTHQGAGRGVSVVRVGIVVLVLVYAWWAVELPSFSSSATVAVLLAGATAAMVGARRRRPEPPRSRAPGLAAWLVLALSAGAWQLMAYLQHPRAEHPTLSSLTNALLDSHPARAAAFVLWIAAAVELSRR